MEENESKERKLVQVKLLPKNLAAAQKIQDFLGGEDRTTAVKRALHWGEVLISQADENGTVTILNGDGEKIILPLL